jgi:hypothetical protein
LELVLFLLDRRFRKAALTQPPTRTSSGCQVFRWRLAGCDLPEPESFYVRNQMVRRSQPCKTTPDLFLLRHLMGLMPAHLVETDFTHDPEVSGLCRGRHQLQTPLSPDHHRIESGILS